MKHRSGSHFLHRPVPPPDIVDKLNKAALAALAKTSVKDRLTVLGIEILADGPDKLGPLMKADHDKWKGAIEKAGIQSQ